MTGLSRSAPAGAQPPHVACDLLNARGAREVLQRVSPDVLIHTQALSDVDRCEREPETAWAQNVTAVERLVQSLGELKATRPTLLVALSTDYVFDGRKGAPYAEGDPTNPINVYGRSKLAAEQAARAWPRAVIVRPSTLFGSGRTNFCDHIAMRLRAAEPVEAFGDQVTSPTYVEDLAEAIGQLSWRLWRSWDAHGPRVFHLVNAGGCSRAAFALRIADLLRAPRGLIRVIPMAAQQRPAPRPAYSALTSVHSTTSIGRILRPWDEALHAYLQQRHWLN